MIARMRFFVVPALLLAAALAGCGGPAGIAPDGVDDFGPAAPIAATGQMTWSLSLTEFGIAPSRAYENFTLEVNLVHEADDPQPPVNESASFGTDGTASITVALAIGQWRLVHLTVYEGEIRRLANTEEVTFLVNPGQNTPVHVVMEEVAGTATFDITLDDSPTSELAGHVVIQLSDRLVDELIGRCGPTLVVRANPHTGGLNDDYDARWMDASGRIDLGSYPPGSASISVVLRANNAAFTWAWWQVATIYQDVTVAADRPTVIDVD